MAANKRLTPREVYDMINHVVAMSAMVRALTPSSIMLEEQASRIGNKEAIKRTWYYFNNQEEFMKLPLIEFYYSKD